MLVHPLLEQEDVKISVVNRRQAKKATKKSGKKAAAPAGQRVRVELPSGRRLVLGFATRGEGLRLTSIRGDVLLMDGRKARVQVRLTRPRAFGEISFPSVIDSRTLCEGKLVETMHEEITAIDWQPDVAKNTFRIPPFDTKLLEPRIKTTEPSKGLMMLHRGAYGDMGKTVEKLKTACQQAELPNLGSFVTIYLNDPHTAKDPSELRTEVILPVMVMGSPPETLPEGISVKDLPATEVASKLARGKYGKADVQALMELFAFLENKGLQPAGSPRTVYFHDPAATVGEDQTAEVQVPIQKE
jgi:effector-binding domain-containing protein